MLVRTPATVSGNQHSLIVATNSGPVQSVCRGLAKRGLERPVRPDGQAARKQFEKTKPGKLLWASRESTD